MLRSTLAAVITVFLTFAHASASDLVIASPDNALHVVIAIRNGKPPAYSLTYKGSPVLTNALAGFHDNAAESVISTSRASVHRQLNLLFAENDHYQEIYNELTIRLTGKKALVFRVYNDGMAFRYVWNAPDSILMEQEYTTYPLLNDSLYQQDISQTPEAEWAKINGPEERYSKVESRGMKGTAEFPLLVESKTWSALINEAGNTGFPRGVLEKHDSVVQVHLLGKAIIRKGSFQSPWRSVLIADSSIRLLNKASMIYSLSPQKAFENTSWIRPGKMMRSMQLTTDAVIQTIDFCHAMQLQYVLLDAGWYGLGYGMAEQSDPRSDALIPVDKLDLPAIIKYGKSKNVGLILYVNEVALRRQLSQILPLYKKWGVAGIKFGFVYSRTGDGQQFVMDAVKQCAQAGLIVDVHDDYRPTGMSRTYPNLLTQEGVRGAENMPNADHNTILPFARFTTGAADYTIIYKGARYRDTNLLSKEERQGKIFNMASSPAHQLALSVVFFSPLQCVFWYGNAADYDPSSVDVEFFREVPTVWDTSVAICGETGKYITQARRNKEKWFIGSITNTVARQWTVPLQFLTKGARYRASIFEDDGKGGIRKTSRSVSSTDNIEVILSPSGGQAIMIEPVR